MPTEIDEVQRRLTQLELAARQLADETEEHAKERLAEINEEMAELQAEAGQPPRAVGSREAGPGRRGRTCSDGSTRPSVKYDQLDADDQASSRRPGRVDETAYQKLYELDSRAQEAARSIWKTRPTKQADRRQRRRQRRGGCCARKSAPTKSPKSSAPGPAFPSPACWKPNGPSCSCSKSGCTSA